MAAESNGVRSQDKMLRDGVRQNLSVWLDKLECGGDIEKKLQYKMNMVKKLTHSPIAIHTDKANEQHYEVPTEFFQTVLGKRLKYSSAYWPEGVETLDKAEDAMLELVCRRARIEDGHSVMDLGCGWGVTGVWLCERYPKCTVLCVSNSMTQRQFIEGEALRRGYNDRLQCITADANVFTTPLKFDRIISVEMFEHMKNYAMLTARVASWLKPSGLLFIQILCHREFAYEFKTKSTSETEWMARNFFSGGTMPSDDLLFYFQKDIFIVDHWRLNGNHYTKTLEAWLDKMDSNRSRVKDIFTRAYGVNDVSKQVFNWRMFFIYCAEVFGFRGGNEWIVSHYLFRRHPTSSL